MFVSDLPDLLGGIETKFVWSIPDSKLYLKTNEFFGTFFYKWEYENFWYLSADVWYCAHTEKLDPNFEEMLNFLKENKPPLFEDTELMYDSLDIKVHFKTVASVNDTSSFVLRGDK